MKIEIKSYWSGSVLFECEIGSLKLALELAVKRGADLQGAYLQGAYLRGAYLRGADLQDADLQGAYLRDAYLRGAYLQGAYLRGADLRGAYLRGADLRGAYLRGAKNLNKFTTTPLYILKDQPEKIVAYKLVNSENVGPFNGGIIYEIGKTYTEKEANTDEYEQCAQGINLATLDWCIMEWKKGYKILMVEFTKEQIAAIPIGSDGKFRVYGCKIIGEKNLKELGLE